jgi:hypothetical protein
LGKKYYWGQAKKLKTIYIMVEGQTEESFINNNIYPLLMLNALWAQPILLTTSRSPKGKPFKGGFPPYSQVKKEILSLLHEGHRPFVTTMFDYYALPDTFPGKTSVPNGNCFQKAQYLENELAADINSKRFIPYLQLHEFEALLFSSTMTIATTMNEPNRVGALDDIMRRFRSPEEINDNRDTCPSARIKKIFPNYRKVLHGSRISNAIGLRTVLGGCDRFKSWYDKISNL